jgi:Transposase DDE domain
LTRSQGDAANLMRQQALQELRRLHPRRGDTVELILDDTRNAKRARQMEAVSKIGDHVTQQFVRGHRIVSAALRFRGVVRPWCFDWWLPLAYTGKRHYRKMTEMAAQIIRAFPDLGKVRVRVLFDAYYLSPVVTRACVARGYPWFSVAAKNRCFTPQGSHRQKLAHWAPGRLRHQGQRVRRRRSRGWRWMRIAGADGRWARIGDVRLVLSKRPRDPWKKLVVIAMNATGMKARDIVAAYENRWAIEVLFKELKGTLGLGAYQVLSERGIRHHLHLCGLAHLLLTHHSLEAVGAKARKANQEGSLPPLPERLEALRDDLRRDRLDRLVRRTRHKDLRRKLKKYLVELLPETAAA